MAREILIGFYTRDGSVTTAKYQIYAKLNYAATGTLINPMYTTQADAKSHRQSLGTIADADTQFLVTVWVKAGTDTSNQNPIVFTVEAYTRLTNRINTIWINGVDQRNSGGSIIIASGSPENRGTIRVLKSYKNKIALARNPKLPERPPVKKAAVKKSANGAKKAPVKKSAPKKGAAKKSGPRK